MTGYSVHIFMSQFCVWCNCGAGLSAQFFRPRVTSTSGMTCQSKFRMHNFYWTCIYNFYASRETARTKRSARRKCA